MKLLKLIWHNSVFMIFYRFFNDDSGSIVSDRGMEILKETNEVRYYKKEG